MIRSDQSEMVQLRIALLDDAYNLARDVAGNVWPTLGMAFGSLFERGVSCLLSDAQPQPLRGGAPAELLDALNSSREELMLAEADYHFTRATAYALTKESERLETAWIELADEHLENRSRIVACRREEEQLKRELKALGAATVPLPEHEELPEPVPNRSRKSRGMYANLFDGVEEMHVDLDVDARLSETADRIAEERGWTSEWGDRRHLLVFVHGLSDALREREADQIDPDDPDSVRTARDRAREHNMGLEGRLATLRFRLFELRHSVRILGWRITALRIEADGMRSRLELFERDRARLNDELTALRASRPIVEDVSPSSGSGGWRARLARLFGAEARSD